MPAAPVFHLIFKHVAVQNAAIDERDRDFLFVIVAVLVDEVPSATGDVFVGAGDGALPVFFLLDGSLDALAPLKPVCGAEHSSETEEEVGSHDGVEARRSRIKDVFRRACRGGVSKRSIAQSLDNGMRDQKGKDDADATLYVDVHLG